MSKPLNPHLDGRPYMKADGGNTTRSVGHLCFDRKKGYEFYLDGDQVHIAKIRDRLVDGRRPGSWLCHINYAHKALDIHFQHVDIG